MNRKVVVAAGYHCPLCPEHTDETFVHSILAPMPICEGCAIELDNFSEEEERPADPLIDKVEQLTGQPWKDCRKLLLKQTLDLLESLVSQGDSQYVEAVHELKILLARA